MKNNNGLLYLIIILLIANLGGTLWLISKSSSTPSKSVSETNTIDKSKVIAEFDNAIAVYNSGDKEAIWDMFSEFARAQMDREKTVNSIVSLKAMPLT